MNPLALVPLPATATATTPQRASFRARASLRAHATAAWRTQDRKEALRTIDVCRDWENQRIDDGHNKWDQDGDGYLNALILDLHLVTKRQQFQCLLNQSKRFGDANFTFGYS